MIKLEASNNYLFVTLADGNKYSGFATNFEFQQENEEVTNQIELTIVLYYEYKRTKRSKKSNANRKFNS